MVSHEALCEFITILGKAPDSQLDLSLSKSCREFSVPSDDPVVFLRNLRDMVVHIGGGSLVIMQSLNALLSDYPELPADTDRRIAMLEKNETTAHKPH